jgi:cystathionine beta-lyase family protein involved in aluminum resistance
MTEQKAVQLIEEAEAALAAQFKQAEKIALSNQRRILDAFREHRLTEEFFAERTGYGMDDAGREAMDKIFASALQAEAAAVRMQLVSGTHALACALFGNLKPGDRMAAITGAPYDTMEQVIGHKVAADGSLKALSVDYIEGDAIDPSLSKESRDALLQRLLAAPTRLAYIQKSCGYSFDRRSISVTEIEELCAAIRKIRPECIIMVDNCYGEFVEDREPPAVGADLIAGSLIKNPGGGLAISGGYIAGKQRYVDAALTRLTAPGIGGHLGLTFNQNRLLMQGLFMAPTVVCNAVKGAMLIAELFNRLGYAVRPQPDERRVDIIQSIKFGEADALIAFLKSIQASSPVNAHVAPEPAEMPGYEDKVVMAGGTFVEGSTIEFSADGPLRPPFVAFVQGGLSYFHIKCALIGAVEAALSGNTPLIQA